MDIKRFQRALVVFDHVIWNDVSGIVDTQTIAVLEKFSRLRYVLCHNLAPERSETTNHMDYTRNDLSVIDLKNFFEAAIKKLRDLGISPERIILDPCFGFSKSYDQNISLLESISSIADIHPHWLIGISKNSFLQKLVQADSPELSKEQLIAHSELIHWDFLKRLSYAFLGKTLYFRVHEVGNITT